MTSRAPRLVSTVAWALLALLLALDAQASTPKRILIVHSFGRDFAPYDTIASVFRTELARRDTEPITFFELNLDFRRSNDKEERAFVEFLGARFDEGPPDIVVTLGPPAGRFYLRHRAELFPGVPWVAGALDERFAKPLGLAPGDAVVASKFDAPTLVDNILRLLPRTRTIAVVLGASELERTWLAEVKRELVPYAGRIEFEWLDTLSLTQMQERVASLPPDSAVLYGFLVVDAAGVPHERLDALASLRAVTSAPIFGVYESELGNGVVGGPYLSQRERGERMAAVVHSLLEKPGAPLKVDTVGFQPAAYDWRELKRWGIDPSLLPAGSTVDFKPPSVWEEHRVAVIATTAALLLQAMLISALLLQRAHRRRAELEAEGLAGRLVTAHEDERRRLARELHDDVTQRIAGLAIEAAELEGRAASTPGGDAAYSIRSGLVELGEDVHALSYRLHPSVIEDLGLVEALRIECDRVAQQPSLRVLFDCEGLPRHVPAGAALCLFRVAQEALRNVERHARATRVDVAVTQKDGGIALDVRDDGAGFDPSRARERASLGLASMRERARLVGGRVRIESVEGGGTSLHAWVPLAEAA